MPQMRLDKLLSHLNCGSRKEVQAFIRAGRVSVDGTVQKDPAFKVDPDRSQTAVDGTVQRYRAQRYYMLNKPTGYITTVDDEQDRPTVMDLLDDINERVYPIGRLDYNTSGMLLLTNDGDLAFKLTHPNHNVFKTYIAEVAGFLTMSEAKKLERGVDIGKHITAPAKVEIISQSDSTSVAQIKISEGKNRQVRRMFEAVGHRVVALERTAIGNMKMAHLRQGQYRKLSNNEIEYLKSL